MKLKVLLIVSLLFVSINLFATTHYEINTSSIVANQNYENYSQAGYGGVFYVKNSGELIVSSSIFRNNKATFGGGAIYNSGQITITSKTVFDSNVGSSSGAAGKGGAIYNVGTAIIDSETVFISNTGYDGGAIVNEGIIDIGNNVIFSSNSASTEYYSNAGPGGAIWNTGTMMLGSEAIFNSNYGSYTGGAIGNCGTIIIDSEVIFRLNSSIYSGGAIFNKDGNLTIKDGAEFINNVSSQGKGGAIYNYNATLDLIANTNNIEFTGNTANGVSNAIHDNSGTINLWVSERANIIFNDRITSENNNSILNINNSTTTLTTSGKIIFNEDMSGFTGIVTLYGGEVELKSKGTGINTNKFFKRIVNLSSGTLNIINNAIDNIVISTFTSTENANLKFDVDLSNNMSDNFTILESTDGILNLTAINIITSNQDSGQITLFTNEKAPILNIQTNAIYDGYEYVFTNDGTAGVLNYRKTGLACKTFKEYINVGEPKIRSYSLAKNEFVTENLGFLGGEQLTIFGNGYNIDGNLKAGINVSENQILNIENIREVKNFSSEDNGSFLNNEGIINLSDNILFSSNTVSREDSCGGAIYNRRGIFTIGNNIIFEKNKSLNGKGGALYNEGHIYIGNNVEFKSNIAQSGGAICNNGGTITIGANAIFNGNKVETNAGNAYGGAIYNEGGTITIEDGAKFTNNKAKGKGGAVYLGGTLNLIAKTNNVEFTGNKANGASSAIYDNGGTINLWAGNKSIIFNDKVESNDGSSILNINQSSGTLPTTGKIILNEDMTGYTGTVNFYGGTIELGENGTLFGGNVVVENSPAINMSNSIIAEHNCNALRINNNLNLIVDADLKKGEMDTISSDSFSGDGKITVSKINILSDIEENETTEIEFANEILKGKVESVNTASSKFYNYDVVYDPETGFFTFANTGVINLGTVASAVAASVGGYATQSVVVNQVFAGMDGKISNKKSSSVQYSNLPNFQSSNLYVSAGDQVFEDSGKIEKGLWLRPFVLNETVKIGDTDVDNNLYGTLAGIDFPLGQDKQLSFYLGYAGSKQEVEEIKSNQTGYIVGATGMIIKDSWYAGLTANVIFNKASVDTDFGTDDIDMNMFTIGAKAGYNYNINEKWTLEPNVTIMYGKVNSQSYETSQGAKIDSQSINNILVEPQVKAKLGLSNGWQPYALVGYAANLSSKPTVKTEGVELELDSIDGYVEYGLGVNKDFVGTVWSCYAQVTGRSGGRNGVAGNLGIKYKF